MTVEFGLPAGLTHDQLGQLGQLVEELGYEGMWVNDTLRGDGLADLAALAEATQRLKLSVGVLPLDRRTPAKIAAAVRGLPSERITIGIGSGNDRSAIKLVTEGVAALRSELPGWSIYVGASGPKVLRLAAEIADGILLNWSPPSTIARIRQEIGGDGRNVPFAAYVRAAIGAGAIDLLRAERQRYAAVPVNALHFGTVEVDEHCNGWLDPDDPQPCLERYAGVLDRVVVRALTADPSLAGYSAVARRYAPS